MQKISTFPPFTVVFCSGCSTMKFQPWTQSFLDFPFETWYFLLSSSFFKSCELSLFRDSSTISSVSCYQTKVNFYSYCVKTICAAPSPNLSTTYDLLPFLPSNSNLQPTQTLNTVFSINVLFAHKKNIINLILPVRWVLRLPCEITQKIPSHPHPLSCPAPLRPPTKAATHQRGRWQMGSQPPLSENCHPLSCLSGPGEKCQSCRAASPWFCSSDTRAWCFLAVRTQHPFFSFLGLQSGWDDVSSKSCLQKLHNWSYQKVSFPFWHISVLLNHRVSQFGKIIMEAE